MSVRFNGRSSWATSSSTWNARSSTEDRLSLPATASRSAGLHPDHEVVAAVHEHFGFLLFSAQGHTAILDGDPASPAWTTPGGHHFPTGSGAAAPTLIEAVTEFLNTQERPTCVTWHQTQPSTP
ncbi:Imm1 family immunity protein [Saccharothrix lopnurensis]|uniref:Imm1 family immunity protein n=1 Tax=Saccharothrix lopnurensis TaxID=1670621 RepID=A0ABW1PEW3_9PSEU